MKPFSTTLKADFKLIDLTPLVDIVFLLLIFFIIASDLLPFKALNIENPSKKASPLAYTAEIAIAMDSHEVIYLGSKKAIMDFKILKNELSNLIDAVKERNGGKNPVLVLNVDKKASYGSFLSLYSIAEECSNDIKLRISSSEIP